MSSKQPTDVFEALEYDSAETAREDARIGALEAQHDADARASAAAALDAAAVQHAVAQCLHSCLACLDVLYLPRDAIPVSEVARDHVSWLQEAEPLPCTRDAWLRGALPEVMLPARAASAAASAQCSSQRGPRTSTAASKGQQRPLSGLLPRRKGPASVASSAAGEPAAGGGAPSKQGSRRASLAQSVQPVKASGAAASQPVSRPGSSGNGTQPAAAAPAADRPELTADSPAADAGADAPAPQQEPVASGQQQQQQQQCSNACAEQQQQQPHAERQEAGERLRQELQLRRQQEGVARQLRQKGEAAQAALVALQRDLKGKEYTYDARGQVVLLARVQPDALPAPLGPQFKVHVAADSTAGAAAATGGSTTTAGQPAAAAAAGKKQEGSSTTKAKAQASCGGSNAPSMPFFVQQASHSQPPLMQTLQPAAGVTLRVGGAARRGPKRDAGSQQPTREQFQAHHAKTANQQAVAARHSASAGGGANSSSRVALASAGRGASGGGG